MLLEAAAAAAMIGGAVVGIEAVRRWRAASKAEGDETSDPSHREGQGLSVGDVLSLPSGDHWLAGSIVLGDHPKPTRIFTTPSARDEAGFVVEWALDERPSIVLAIDSPAAFDEGRIPDTTTVDGLPHRAIRRRGGAVRAEGEGLEGLCPVGARATWVALRGPGRHRALVVDFDDGSRLSLVGETIDERSIDRLPGSHTL